MNSARIVYMVDPIRILCVRYGSTSSLRAVGSTLGIVGGLARVILLDTRSDSSKLGLGGVALERLGLFENPLTICRQTSRRFRGNKSLDD